jgi:hypothetical protein
MGTLQFDGTDEIQFTTLSAALQDVGTGAYTVACVFDLATTGDWHSLVGLAFDQTPTVIGDIQVAAALGSATSVTLMDLGQGSGNSNGTYTTFATNVPYLFVASKAAGSASPAGSVKRLDTGVWNHATHSPALANSTDRLTSSSILQVGKNPFSSILPLTGHMGLFAYWNGLAMDQTQRMACGTNNKTSDLYLHSAGAPTTLTELNTTSPVDLAGGWGSMLVFATPTLDGAVSLSWTYDGTGTPQVAPAIDYDWSAFPQPRRIERRRTLS